MNLNVNKLEDEADHFYDFNENIKILNQAVGRSYKNDKPQKEDRTPVYIVAGLGGISIFIGIAIFPSGAKESENKSPTPDDVL